MKKRSAVDVSSSLDVFLLCISIRHCEICQTEYGPASCGGYYRKASTYSTAEDLQCGGKTAYTRSRHGARLDAADPQWHLTSPTPYDPPLTYGGWKQSQILGARIASIIHDRENALDDHHQSHGESSGSTQLLRARHQKHKVVIHTSPFLRCVQTSIAICAGMKQYSADKAPLSSRPHIMHSGSPMLRAKEHAGVRNLAAIPEPEEGSARRSRTISPGRQHDSRTTLRVDAFLGEWLSPDYYENITPPPGSKMMVAGAKADLLRRSDPIDALNASSNAFKQGHFPGGWRGRGLDSKEPQHPVEDDAFSDLSSLKDQLPKVARANTFSSERVSNVRTGRNVGGKSLEQTTGYTPPTPSYAVSPSQAIPQGYVAHARDACVNVDYQWDSLRPPLEWGNGGEYGEEWSAMHRRFRKGLHEILSWYRKHDPSQEPEDAGTLSPSLTKTDTNPSEELDDNSDTILVIITHGAGCNALIGALTNQPVLIDVGMASLTMAERKNIDYTRLEFRDGYSHSPTRTRRSSIDSGDSEEYDVKLIASMDHLRPGSHFNQDVQRERSPTMPSREKSPYRYERHVKSQSHHQSHPPSSPLHDTFSIESGVSVPSPKVGSFKRSLTTSTPPSRGLWTPPKPKIADVTPEMKSVAVRPRSSDPKAGSTIVSETRPSSLQTSSSPMAFSKDVNSSPETPTGRSLAQTGLWGAPPHALATERNKGAKRRWTLSQAA